MQLRSSFIAGLQPGFRDLHGLLIVTVVLSVVVSGCKREETMPKVQRNAPRTIVLISLDTLRADRTSVYGYERNTTPNLATFAKESVVFETVSAQATQTLVSHKSMFAAKYPLRLLRETVDLDAAAKEGKQHSTDFLVGAFRSAGSPSLIEGLRQNGFTTSGFTDGGWMVKTMGFDDGFDHFDESAGHFARILPRTYDWLESNQADALFLFLHTYDTHCPYPCREPFNTQYCVNHTQHVSIDGLCGKPHLVNMALSPDDLKGISDHYDGGIASADAHMGELFAKLRSYDLYDDAMIIVTSDHGESLGEHEQIGHGGLYLEQLLVPLIIKFPASWSIGPQRVTGPVQLVDIFPTIYDACGFELPENVDGVSLMSLVDGARNKNTYSVAQTTFKEGRASVTDMQKRALLRPAQWLFIHSESTESAELFDLAMDPQGLTDVYRRDLSTSQAMLAELRLLDQLGTKSSATDVETVPLSEKQVEQLRTLGYIDD